jgi:hypothetical protein
MSIVPASRLSASDLSHLGNNLRRDGRRKITRPGSTDRRRLVAAVNRSLAGLGERIARLHRPMMVPS